MNELEKTAGEELMHSYVNPNIGHFEYGREAMLNMFRKGAQWQAKQSPWISVEERLPEEYKEVLVRYKDCAETKYDVLFIYGSTSWCFADMEEYIDESMTVTHWMPIPE